MDNFEVAMSGVALAARILNIKTPDVQFFNDINLNKKGINAVFLKDEYIIAFNEEWIEQANPMEIQVTCFHESRHAFQWKVITGEYSGNEVITPITIQKWKNEMSNYNQPTKNDIPEEEYLKQDVEIDAIAFAYFQMDKQFNVKGFIPASIINKVNHICGFLEENYK